MTYAAAGIVGGALVVGAGTQAYFGNKSAKKAAKAQAAAAAAFEAEMRRAQQRSIGYQQPYEQAGRSGLNLLQQYLTGDPVQTQQRLEASPGYQFRLQQGQKSIQNLLASQGGLKSGGAMKALTEFAQGTASQEFGNQVGYLQGLAGIGQNAAIAMSNTEMRAGTDIANAQQQGILGQGMTMANRDAQMGNIIGGGFSQFGSLMALSGAMGGGAGRAPTGGASTGGYQPDRISSGMASMPNPTLTASYPTIQR